jgi:hypothetical protein
MLVIVKMLLSTSALAILEEEPVLYGDPEERAPFCVVPSSSRRVFQHGLLISPVPLFARN